MSELWPFKKIKMVFKKIKMIIGIQKLCTFLYHIKMNRYRLCSFKFICKISTQIINIWLSYGPFKCQFGHQKFNFKKPATLKLWTFLYHIKTKVIDCYFSFKCKIAKHCINIWVSYSCSLKNQKHIGIYGLSASKPYESMWIPYTSNTLFHLLGYI